jgi:predicted transcriptional regulator
MPDCLFNLITCTVNLTSEDKERYLELTEVEQGKERTELSENKKKFRPQ